MNANCENCGEEISEGEAVSGSGSLKEGAGEKVAGGELVGVEDVFAFDEKYCSLGCAITGDN